MEFSDPTTQQGLVQHVRFITGQTNETQATIARLLNFALDQYTYLAFMADGAWKFDASTEINHPTATTDLTSGQRDYIFAKTHLSIERVDIKMEDGKWKTLDQIDHKDASSPLDELYENDNEPAYYDMDGQKLVLYPAPDYTQAGGVRVRFTRPVTHFSAETASQQVGIIPIHNEYLAMHAAHNIMLSRNDPSATRMLELVKIKEDEIKTFFGERNETQTTTFKTSLPVIS